MQLIVVVRYLPAMKRSTWLMIVCGFGHSGLAQEVRIDTVKAQQPWYQKELYTFPKVVMPKKPTVAAAINKDLCIDLLEVDPDTTAPGQLFNQVWGDTVSGWMPRLNSVSWYTERPFKNVLVVEFEAEGCGAYCEWSTTYRIYDLRSGHRLELDSLLTPEGMAVVLDTIDARWRRIVSEEIRTWEDAVRWDATEHQELYREGLAMYRDCLDERPKARPYVGDIKPWSDALRCWVARCSAHVNRELDELDAVEVDLSYRWLSPYLRPEIRALFKH